MTYVDLAKSPYGVKLEILLVSDRKTYDFFLNNIEIWAYIIHHRNGILIYLITQGISLYR